MLAILQSLCRSSQSVADSLLEKEATLKGITAALQVRRWVDEWRTA